jgi:hypothetical protein
MMQCNMKGVNYTAAHNRPRCRGGGVLTFARFSRKLRR